MVRWKQTPQCVVGRPYASRFTDRRSPAETRYDETRLFRYLLDAWQGLRTAGNQYGLVIYGSAVYWRFLADKDGDWRGVPARCYDLRWLTSVIVIAKGSSAEQDRAC